MKEFEIQKQKKLQVKNNPGPALHKLGSWESHFISFKLLSYSAVL